MTRRRVSWVRGLALLATVVGWSCVDGLPTEVAPPPPDVPVLFAIEPAPSMSADEEEAVNNAFDRVDEIHVRLFRPGETEPFIDTVVVVVPGQDEYSINILVPEEETGQSLSVDLTASAGGVELISATVQVTVESVDAGPGEDRQIVSLPVRYSGPGLSGFVQDPDGLAAVGAEVELSQDGEVRQTAITSVLGEYLFTDLQPGSYTLTVRTGQGITSCPASREIGPINELDKIAGSFRLSRTGCSLRVLVLAGGDVDDSGAVAGALGPAVPEGDFSTAFVVVGPPSLSSMRQYDVVLLFGNGTYDHATRVGDRIAQYVAAGGNVVIGSFYWQNRSDGGYGHPGWGALEDLDPFTSSGGAVYGPGSLGSSQPHPITDGVANFSVARWWGGVSAKGSTAVVATWSDGTPMAGHRVNAAGNRIVAISAFPGSMGTAGGQLTRLYANAIRWAGAAGGPVGAPGG